MKILPSDLCDRRRVPPPRLSRPDRPAAHGGRRRAFLADTRDDAVKARRAGRPAGRQPRLRRLLDQQVGRPVAGQPQVPRRRGRGGLPQLDPRPGRPRTRPTISSSARSSPPRARTARTRPRRTSRFSATRRRRWRTRRTCSWRVRFNCNKCHDHPFERWTQDQYYQTAAYFAQVGLKADPASGERRIGGTAVEGGQAALRDRLDDADKAR